ncbi:MAG: hypothetical protein NVS9B8_10240 [Candidatus Limnocylindrales bacterium]
MGSDRLGELAAQLQDACLAAGATLALAESCTGGMVAASLSAIPGSSGYFVGGVVSYADAAKRDLLGVDPVVIAAHGAVSAQQVKVTAQSGLSHAEVEKLVGEGETFKATDEVRRDDCRVRDRDRRTGRRHDREAGRTDLHRSGGRRRGRHPADSVERRPAGQPP